MVMKPTTTSINPQAEQFWKGYFTTLGLFRIPEGAHPWYRKHIEALISIICPISDWRTEILSILNNG